MKIYRSKKTGATFCLKIYALEPTDPSLIKNYGPNIYNFVGESDFEKDFELVSDSDDSKPSITIPVQNPRLKGLSFYLDAGHGGKDPGAVNDNLGLQEKIAALDICLKLGIALEKRGANVYYSRTGDAYPTLTNRAAEANKYNVTAFISIHLNSAENKTARGIETLCYSNAGKAFELAEAVQAEMVAATGFNNRGVKLRPDLTVLKNTKMPAVLCEVGFISNDAEGKLLFQADFQEKIADAICEGVIKEYGN